MVIIKELHIGAASDYIPKELFYQLKIGGRLLIPLGPEDGQYIHFIDKISENEYKDSIGWSVCYVALTSPEAQLSNEI